MKMTTDIALKARLDDRIIEYEQKKEVLAFKLEDLKRVHADIHSACSIRGTYGQENLDLRTPHMSKLQANLLRSAWLNVYDYMGLEKILTAKDKAAFERAVQNPPEFTFNNLKATFGDYIFNPRESILRGLAEVFSTLDPYYKSHEKIKIGVTGLPKRVIIPQVNSIYGYGHDKIRDILNALAAYQNLPLVHHTEISNFIKDGDYLLTDHTIELIHNENIEMPARGVWLKTFKNGNAHLFFDKKSLRDINKALSEYYGDVVADCYEEKPNQKQASREVSKDLQYYPTPSGVVDRLIDSANIKKGDVILEPSCGNGNIMDAVIKNGGKCHGIEVHAGRVEEAKKKGHNVYCGNFLTVPPQPSYDKILMNPPFYGKHYAKHVEHALNFLKNGGVLFAVLPVTAQLDHSLLDKYRPRWQSLPIGSFRESGTNINTVICAIFK